jgi:Domain of unknown function (DUF4382)
MRFRTLFALLLAAALTAFACGESSTSPTSPSTRPSTLNLMIKDSPFTDARAVLVTFSEVTVHRSNVSGGAERLPFAGSATSRTCDLKKLTNAQDVLGTGTLPAGHYTQVRIVVSSAVLYFDNAAEGPACAPTITAPAGRIGSIEIPSGEVRLNREFTVSDSGATTMLVDFDGDRSIHLTGSGRYMMSPVINVVSVQ